MYEPPCASCGVMLDYFRHRCRPGVAAPLITAENRT